MGPEGGGKRGGVQEGGRLVEVPLRPWTVCADGIFEAARCVSPREGVKRWCGCGGCGGRERTQGAGSGEGGGWGEMVRNLPVEQGRDARMCRVADICSARREAGGRAPYSADSYIYIKTCI